MLIVAIHLYLSDLIIFFKIKMPNGEHRTIEFSVCVLAAGCESGEVARLADIGVGPDLLTIPLPVEKRYVCYQHLKSELFIKFLQLL